jgi:cell cycle checkpoint protein
MSDDFIFSCSSDSPRLFSQALNAIAWRQPESQACSIRVSEAGMMFVTEDVKVLQANILFKASIFQSFTLRSSEPYEFRVNLTSLVHCLSVFAETASLLDISGGSESDLRVRICDMGSVTECSIRTLHSTPDQLNQRTLTDAFSARDSVEICYFDISSLVLREVFRFPNERKNKSVSIEMMIDRPNNRFVVKAEGAYGAVRSVIDFDHHDFQKKRILIDDTFAASYPVASLTPMLAAMSQSFETRFTFKDNGMLAAKLGMRGTSSISGLETVVEFILQACDDSSGL